MNLKRFALACAIAVLLALVALQVVSRPVDRDEGFWLYTSWRLASGELPYRDYAFPHLPLAALTYAAAIKVFGPSLYGLRAFNVIIFTLSAGAIGGAVARRFGGRASFFTVVFFSSSSLTLTWLIPIKAHAVATAIVAFAVAIWLAPIPRGRPGYGRALAIGILLGAATLARLPLLVTLAAAAFALWFVPDAKPGRRLGLAATACLGFLAATPLVLYFRLAAGEAFTFNVWGIHELFLDAPAGGRGAAALSLLFPPDPVILIAVAFLALRPGPRRTLAFPLAAGTLILLANLAPGSSQRQYFVTAVAAFAPAAGVGAAWLWAQKKSVAIAVVTAAAVMGAARPAAKVVFDRAHKERVGPAEVYAASRLLAERAEPHDTVYTAWPGYAALARRKVMAGWELGYFTDRIGRKLLPAERRRYHLLTYEETAAALAAGEAAFALDGLDTPEEIRPALERYFDEVESRRGVTLRRYRTNE